VGLVTLLSQKRPIHMSKEIHVKRDLCTCQKRPVYISKCHSLERVGLVQALARERESLREREKESCERKNQRK